MSDMCKQEERTSKPDTNRQFEEVIAMCRSLYVKKLQDYGASWRIMRPESLTDQIFIKAKRIRSIETVFQLDQGYYAVVHDTYQL